MDTKNITIMDITQDKIDTLNSIITIKLSPLDYTARVEKAIKAQAKEVKIAGFRPGMVPIAHLKRMYGKRILIDEINHLLNDALHNYITETKLDILGQPLLKPNPSKKFNWDFTDQFEFIYEMGLAPEFTIDFSSKDRLKHYIIQIDEQTLTEHLGDLRKCYGEKSNPQVSSDSDILDVELKQLAADGRSIFDGGVVCTTSFSLDEIKDSSIKESLIGLEKGSLITINLQKAFDHDTERIADLLDIEEMDVPHLQSLFQVLVTNIERLEESDLNQEFFDKAFGKGVVTTEEECKAKVMEDLASSMQESATQRLQKELHELGFEKINFSLPDDFLKRWLKARDEKMCVDDLEEGYPDFAKKLKWTLVENKIMKDNNIQIKDEALFQKAQKHIQFQVEMFNQEPTSEEQLKNYTVQFLQKKDNLNRMYQELKTECIFDYLKNVVTLDKQRITYAEFVKLA